MTDRSRCIHEWHQAVLPDGSSAARQTCARCGATCKRNATGMIVEYDRGIPVSHATHAGERHDEPVRA
jgi:hypothetical protein